MVVLGGGVGGGDDHLLLLGGGVGCGGDLLIPASLSKRRFNLFFPRKNLLYILTKKPYLIVLI